MPLLCDLSYQTSVNVIYCTNSIVMHNLLILNKANQC